MIIPGKPQILQCLSYIKQTIIYGFCPIIASSIRFTLSLKFKRRNDMASGSLYSALHFTAVSFLIAFQ